MSDMDKEIKSAIASLRRAKNNMSRNEFLRSVTMNTIDANDAEALLLASLQVSYQRIVETSKSRDSDA
jgi:hypothetical protein